MFPFYHHKLDYRSHECVFLGYSTAHKGYKCLSPSGIIFISKDVIFNEFRFPYTDLFPSQAPPTTPISSPIPAQIPLLSSPQISPPSGSSQAPTIPSISPSLDTSSQSSSSSSSPATSPPGSVLSSPSPSPPHVTNVHPMQTRSKSGIVCPRLQPRVLLTHVEPRIVKQALQDPKWFAAMQDEFDALQRNHTWSLVPPPPDRTPIGCKWVFQVKENADGSLNKYKARLVAKGFHQQAGFDFNETFSLVIKTLESKVLIYRPGWDKQFSCSI